MIVFTFREPNRSGLEELKSREKAVKKEEEEEQKHHNDNGPSSEALRPNDDIMDSYADYYDDYDDDSSSVGSAFSAVESTATTSTRTADADGIFTNERGRQKKKTSSSVSKHSPLYCIKNMTRATALVRTSILIAFYCII